MSRETYMPFGVEQHEAIAYHRELLDSVPEGHQVVNALEGGCKVRRNEFGVLVPYHMWFKYGVADWLYEAFASVA